LPARGDTDRQVADALFLTTGTVGWHVHRILQKLDLQSHRQLADRLRAGTLKPHLLTGNPGMKSWNARLEFEARAPCSLHKLLA
jgi:hypothetical protein